MLEKFNVFFSAPLDIDFLMLQYYKEHYLETLSTNEGPVVSYTDENSDNKKIKLTKMDRTNDYQLIGFKNRISEAIQATLKDKSGPGDSFTEEEKELMIWYQYFFLGRGKPTTHMQFLSSISDDELTRNLPPVFKKIVNRAEELLGDIEHGKE
ncbi:Yga2G [Streptococcus pneumoniae]|nr:Yga2G [Streptococcus pneumoniae]VRB87673.1 Yga2G [Streptococcus pneumoniae]